MGKKYLFIAVIFLIAFSLIAFLYIATTTSPYSKPETSSRESLLTASVITEIPLTPDHLNYVLINGVDAYKLHNPPASQETPKIELVIEGRTYNTEIIAGKPNTGEGQSPDPDLRITASKEQIMRAIQAENTKEYLKNAVTEGKVTIDQIGSYSKLFYKGYLTIYNELTGRSLTGNIIRIFSKP